MNDTERKEFARTMTAAWEVYGDVLSKDALEIWWRLFRKYSLEEFRAGVLHHLRDTKSGQYRPKPADIIRAIEGPRLTADEMIAHARVANTPIGVLARIQIGSYDLDCANHYHLRARAEECVAMQDEWKDRIRRDQLTDHERGVLAKYEVEPRLLLESSDAGGKRAAREVGNDSQ